MNVDAESDRHHKVGGPGLDLFGTWRGRRIDVVVLILLYLGGAVLCGATALFPPFDETPVRIAQICVVISLTAAGAMWIAGPRWPSVVVHSALIVHIVVTTMFLASSASPEGATAVAFVYVWVALYVAAFRPLTFARLYVALILACLAIGLAAHPDMTGRIAANSWMVASVTTVAGTEVLGRLLRRLRGLTTIDRLTGAYNRLGFELAAEQARAAVRRRDEPMVLALLDLDEFKAINDERGHAAGDRLLANLVKQWRSAARPDDVICRYGGDEFVILMPATTEAEAEAVLARLADASPIGWTAGWTALDPDEPIASALDRADQQMYARKAAAATSQSA